MLGIIAKAGKFAASLIGKTFGFNAIKNFIDAHHRTTAPPLRPLRAASYIVICMALSSIQGFMLATTTSVILLCIRFWKVPLSFLVLMISLLKAYFKIKFMYPAIVIEPQWAILRSVIPPLPVSASRVFMGLSSKIAISFLANASRVLAITPIWYRRLVITC